VANFAEQVSAVLADRELTPIILAVRATAYRPVSVDQIVAIRLLEEVAEQERAGGEPVAHRDVLNGTTLPRASISRLLPLQAQQFLPLLHAVALGRVTGWTAAAVARVRPKGWQKCLADTGPDAALVAALDEAGGA
jgi:hypothetical protein